MYDNTITFQLATHSLSRIALRLEFLFKTINQACSESHEVIHRFALKNIIEIINIIEKPELKSRFIKELIRIEHALKKPDFLKNDQLFDDLETQIHRLNHVSGRFSTSIQDDEFLRTLRQIHHPNTKECEFNSPHLVLWFESEPDIRQKTITQWVNSLKDLEDTVSIYLSLLREATHYIPITAVNGFYQHNISPRSANHMILLKMDKSMGITPKLQLGHHSLTIRLYELITAHEIRDKSIDMEIAFCQI
ncbi:cell division protein ZapD [uncultured Legionella sp.]|uniref:cell division protein ZapD n=1 Tax=uncultured Legionella sp. TaxID=210934 RepID=UPI00260B0722|nr:cell division protein ZapD [uncultured Legionella sp.]